MTLSLYLTQLNRLVTQILLIWTIFMVGSRKHMALSFLDVLHLQRFELTNGFVLAVLTRLFSHMWTCRPEGWGALCYVKGQNWNQFVWDFCSTVSCYKLPFTSLNEASHCILNAFIYIYCLILCQCWWRLKSIKSKSYFKSATLNLTGSQFSKVTRYMTFSFKTKRVAVNPESSSWLDGQTPTGMLQMLLIS